MSGVRRNLLAGAVALAAAMATAPAHGADTADAAARVRAAVIAHPKLSARIPLYFIARPSVAGTRLHASSEAPVVVRLRSRASAADVAALEAAGLRVARHGDGSAVGHAEFIAGSASPEALEALGALDEVAGVEPDGPPFGVVPPLDVLGAEVQTPDVWRAFDAQGLPLTGAGMTVCMIDLGIDPFHPMFFRADGGYRSWIDVNGDGVLTWGVDTTSDGTVLRLADAVIYDFKGGTLYGSDAYEFQAGTDWLYADLDGSGERERGLEHGFTDATPTFGEPLFAADDVNRNGVLDVGEALVALGSSKVRVYADGVAIRNRGVDLIASAIEHTYHGTASSSIVVGGQRDLGRFVGVAPDADLVMVRFGPAPLLYQNTEFCLSQGARVVLHEYAPWQGFFLDGSSALESLITTTMNEGIAHINPAGNLSGAKKVYKRTLPAGASLTIPVVVPADFEGEPLTLFAFSLLWRDAARDLDITLQDATGASIDASGTVVQHEFHDGYSIAVARETSPRDNVRSDIFIYSVGDAPAPLPAGTWTLTVTDPGPPGPGTELLGFVQDDQSAWDLGIYFPEYDDEAHLVGYPGTADVSLVVAAYTGHGFDGGVPGTRAPYSGRGTRIDGLELLSVSAPDDPVAAVHFDKGGREAPMGPFGGTSGASPFVAGAAALLLQKEPALRGIDVRDRIRAGAIGDQATGPLPNSDWGYGKLRIHRSLFGGDPPPGTPPVVEAPAIHLDAGATASLQAIASDAEDPPSALHIELDRNYDGIYDETLADGRFTVRYQRVGTYFLKVRATDPSGRSGTALARIDVHATLEPSGGSTCAASGHGGRGAGLFGWFLVLGVAWRRREEKGGPGRTVQVPCIHPRV